MYLWLLSLLLLLTPHVRSKEQTYHALLSIPAVLEITLFPTDEETNQEIADICLKWFSQVKANNYLEAIEILYQGLKKYPHSFALQTRLAAVIGDYAGQFSGSEQELLLKKSVQIFQKLYKEVDSQSKREQFYFKNEYNYRFALYKEQYENGVAMINYYFDQLDMSSYGYKGYYFQGVGAANYAKQLLMKHNEKLAKQFAEKALVAWAQYMTYCNNYYNAFVHYGLALGILGYNQEMRRALQQGAALINVDLNYYEFKEIIDFIQSNAS
jgi:hypothetical protein